MYLKIFVLYVQYMYIDQQYKGPLQESKGDWPSLWWVYTIGRSFPLTESDSALSAHCCRLDNIIHLEFTNIKQMTIDVFILFCFQCCVAHQIPTSLSPSHSSLDSIKFHRLNLKGWG